MCSNPMNKISSLSDLCPFDQNKEDLVRLKCEAPYKTTHNLTNKPYANEEKYRLLFWIGDGDQLPALLGNSKYYFTIKN